MKIQTMIINGYRTLPIILMGLLLAGCIAGTTVKTQPDPGEPVANAPKFCRGDKFVGIGWSEKLGTDTWTNVVDKVSGDGSYEIITTSENGKEKFRNYYNEKFQLIKDTNLVTGKDEFVQNPPAKRLDFPLFVGKQWRETFYGRSVDGNRYQYINIYTVTDYQKVDIKAGQFDVFRIWKAQSVGTRSHTEIFYYSPKLKQVIKSDPSWREGYELTDFSITSCE